MFARGRRGDNSGVGPGAGLVTGAEDYDRIMREMVNFVPAGYSTDGRGLLDTNDAILAEYVRSAEKASSPGARLSSSSSSSSQVSKPKTRRAQGDASMSGGSEKKMSSSSGVTGNDRVRKEASLLGYCDDVNGDVNRPFSDEHPGQASDSSSSHAAARSRQQQMMLSSTAAAAVSSSPLSCKDEITRIMHDDESMALGMNNTDSGAHQHPLSKNMRSNGSAHAQHGFSVMPSPIQIVHESGSSPIFVSMGSPVQPSPIASNMSGATFNMSASAASPHASPVDMHAQPTLFAGFAQEDGKSSVVATVPSKGPDGRQSLTNGFKSDQ